MFGAAAGAGALPLQPEIRLSKGRQRIGTFFRLFLPVSATACLWWAFTHPDDEGLVPGGKLRPPPELQYLAAQQTANEEVLTNWSGTHEAKPK